MQQVGQGGDGHLNSRSDARGYIMVALLIGIAVSVVWMGALLPAWRQQTMRDREADMIFRGESYARAIALFFVKNQRLPPNLDVLVEQRYLRRKYKDPITNKDFLPVGGIQTLTGGAPTASRGQSPSPTVQSVPAVSGIFGVRSTSTASSIIVYQGQTTHSQFPFDYQVALQRMGARSGAPAPLNQPGRRGGVPGRGGELPPVESPRGSRGIGLDGPGARGGQPTRGVPPGSIFGPQNPGLGQRGVGLPR